MCRPRIDRPCRIKAAGLAAALMLSWTTAWCEPPPADRVAELVEAGRLREAAAAACAWADSRPGDLEALEACGELGRQVGRYKSAEQALRSLLFHTPNDPRVMVRLGDVLLQQGRYQEARELFGAAIYLHDHLPEAYVGLARAAMYDGESEGDILGAAEVAVSIAPDSAASHTVLGAAQRELGHLEAALQTLTAARELDYDHAPTVYELGLTHALMGDEQAARRAWELYAEMAPFAPQTWLLRRNLAVTRVEKLIDRAYGARYSPDGTHIAYRGRGGGGWGIYVVPAEGEMTETCLWSTEQRIQSFAWSPDGRYIAAVIYLKKKTPGTDRQSWTHELILVPTDGQSEPRTLLEDRYLGEVAWIPTNGHVAGRSHVRQRGWVLLDIDPETGKCSHIPGVDRSQLYYHPVWTRDGSMMAACRRTEALPDGSYAHELLVGPGDDLGAAQVVFESADLPGSPVFTPDGGAIVFTLPGGVSGRLTIWAVPPDGSCDPVPIDHGGGSYTEPSFSPDGRFLLSSRDQVLARLTLAGLKEQ